MIGQTNAIETVKEKKSQPISQQDSYMLNDEVVNPEDKEVT